MVKLICPIQGCNKTSYYGVTQPYQDLINKHLIEDHKINPKKKDVPRYRQLQNEIWEQRRKELETIRIDNAKRDKAEFAAFMEDPWLPLPSRDNKERDNEEFERQYRELMEAWDDSSDDEEVLTAAQRLMSFKSKAKSERFGDAKGYDESLRSTQTGPEAMSVAEGPTVEEVQEIVKNLLSKKSAKVAGMAGGEPMCAEVGEGSGVLRGGKGKGKARVERADEVVENGMSSGYRGRESNMRGSFSR